MKKNLESTSPSVIVAVCFYLSLIMLGAIVSVFGFWQLINNTFPTKESYLLFKTLSIIIFLFSFFYSTIIHYQRKLYTTYWRKAFTHLSNLEKILLNFGSIFFIMGYLFSIWNIVHLIEAGTKLEIIITSFILIYVSGYISRKIGAFLAEMMFSNKEEYPDYQYFYYGNDVPF